jgi:stage V sporulation protein D (sporulation-specific penicillin-binding protein)
MNPSKIKNNKRITFLSYSVIFIGCLVVARLFSLQVINKEIYNDKADRQYATPKGSIFDRGTIFFTKKDGTLVSAGTIMTGFKLAINPKQITEAEKVYELLNNITPIDKQDFIDRTKKKNDPYEEIKGRLTKEIADKIEALKISGVYIYQDKWRFYPGGTLASHVIGFVSFKGDDLLGRYGIERSYNEALSRGKKDPYINFFAEVFSNIGETFFDRGDVEGDVVMNIEPTVQVFAEKSLQNLHSKWNPDSAGIIIIDPNTGAIYAMAATPDFNPNEFNKIKTGFSFSNPLIEGVIEMGSVIKPLVMAAGIDAGVVTASTTYMDNGFVQVADKVVNNFDKKGRGRVDMQEVLNQSLNTGMVFVEQKLGKQKFREYMLGYKIGEKTGIDLPGEVAGIVSNLKAPGEVEYANAAFGQGIALTPIQAVRAFSILANGGKLINPHIVNRIDYSMNKDKKTEQEAIQLELLKPETTKEITRMLVDVVDNYGEGSYKLNNYSIAGKTGTAQVADLVNGGYYKNQHTHSFFGYFPAYQPKFLIYLYVKNPKGALYASQSVLPVFMENTKFLLNYYEVAPDR